MPRLGNGSFITFSGLTQPLLSVDGPDVKCNTVPVPTMATTGGMPKLADPIVDPGEMTCTVEFNGEAHIVGTTGTIAVGYGSTTADWSSNAICTGFKPGAQIGARVEAEVRFELSGDISAT